MRTLVFAAVIVQCFAFCFGQSGTSPVTAATSETVTLNSIAAFSAVPVSSVQITGAAQALAGSTNETGTFTFEIRDTGTQTFNLSVGTLSKTEQRNEVDSLPQCTWSAQDGITHGAAESNCWVSLNFVLPMFSVAHTASVTTKQRIDDGLPQSEPTILFTRSISDSDSGSQAIQRKLSAAKLTFNTGTWLPSMLTYNLHPDSDDSTEVPVLVRYSAYEQVNGVSVPFHIAKYINQSKVLDLQVQHVEVTK